MDCLLWTSPSESEPAARQKLGVFLPHHSCERVRRRNACEHAPTTLTPLWQGSRMTWSMEPSLWSPSNSRSGPNGRLLEALLHIRENAYDVYRRRQALQWNKYSEFQPQGKWCAVYLSVASISEAFHHRVGDKLSEGQSKVESSSYNTTRLDRGHLTCAERYNAQVEAKSNPENVLW
jgi:hypothetical protein